MGILGWIIIGLVFYVIIFFVLPVMLWLAIIMAFLAIAYSIWMEVKGPRNNIKLIN